MDLATSAGIPLIEITRLARGSAVFTCPARDWKLEMRTLRTVMPPASPAARVKTSMSEMVMELELESASALALVKASELGLE